MTLAFANSGLKLIRQRSRCPRRSALRSAKRDRECLGQLLLGEACDEAQYQYGAVIGGQTEQRCLQGVTLHDKVGDVA